MTIKQVRKSTRITKDAQIKQLEQRNAQLMELLLEARETIRGMLDESLLKGAIP